MIEVPKARFIDDRTSPWTCIVRLTLVSEITEKIVKGIQLVHQGQVHECYVEATMKVPVSRVMEETTEKSIPQKLVRDRTVEKTAS